jgi:hypothetical protein
LLDFAYVQFANIASDYLAFDDPNPSQFFDDELNTKFVIYLE